VLLAGLNHVGVLTNDTDRLHAFYSKVFDATVFHDFRDGGMRLSLVGLGPAAQLNVFEIEGNTEADRQSPMFGRGRIDHIGLEAASQESFDEIRERLTASGSTDGFVTDFGIVLSIFFTDRDVLEGEICLQNRRATAADLEPSGTPAAGYERVS